MARHYSDSYFDFYLTEKKLELIGVQQFMNELLMNSEDQQEKVELAQMIMICFDADRLLDQFAEFKSVMDEKINTARYEYTKLKAENYDLKKHIHQLEKSLDNAIEGM